MNATSHVNSPAMILALCAALLAAPSMAQKEDDLATRANTALQASDWAKAAELYTELTAAKPDDAAAWYRLALATLKSGGNTSAGRLAFERALELGFPAGQTLFGIAKSHAMDGNTEATINTLERLADQGPAPVVVSLLGGDEAFSSLSSNERFQTVVARLTPCTSEEYRQFDFWLGSWRVVSPQGQALGTNTVTESMDGCLLIENWESGQGGQKGMSLNYYDRDKGTWSQIYRDNSGNIAQWPELIGNFVDGSMVLESAPDTQPRTRWAWTLGEDGRVRQMAESSSDGGDTWTVVWDSYYVRVSQ